MKKEQDRQVSLSILSQCLELTSSEDDSNTEGDSSKEKRLDDLMATFVETETLECASGWHFCLRPSFRSALDIKQTKRQVKKKAEMRWTQGSWFHFKKGDTLYDSPDAYRPWDVNNFRCCIDVTTGSSAQPPNGKDRRVRNPGSIAFNVLVPDATKTKLVQHAVKVMTQDDFVRMLIIGPPEDWGL